MSWCEDHIGAQLTRQSHRRAASATCRRPSPTAAAASSTPRRSRALRYRRTSGRGSWAGHGRGCIWPSSTMLAVGRERAAGPWSSTATASPCSPVIGTQSSSGLFRWSCTRSLRQSATVSIGVSLREISVKRGFCLMVKILPVASEVLNTHSVVQRAV